MLLGQGHVKGPFAVEAVPASGLLAQTNRLYLEKPQMIECQQLGMVMLKLSE